MAGNIEHVISCWLLFQKFHSPVLAGFADISHWTPFRLLSVYFGAIADRHDCRKVIQLAQIMYMVVSVARAVLFYTDTVQVWHAAILLILHGMARVLWTPAEQLIIHDMVYGAYPERSAAQRHQPSDRNSFRSCGGRWTDAVTESVHRSFYHVRLRIAGL
jgi:Transmembrane secretion effector